MKRSEVIPAVVAIATATVTKAFVTRNARTESDRKAIEAKLVTAGNGYVLEIDPLAGASTQEGSLVKTGAFSSDSVVIMRLRLNSVTAPAGVTQDAMLDDADALICALLADQSLDTSISGTFLDELPLDDGLRTYQITVTVKTDTSAT